MTAARSCMKDNFYHLSTLSSFWGTLYCFVFLLFFLHVVHCFPSSNFFQTRICWNLPFSNKRQHIENRESSASWPQFCIMIVRGDHESSIEFFSLDDHFFLRFLSFFSRSGHFGTSWSWFLGGDSEFESPASCPSLLIYNETCKNVKNGVNQEKKPWHSAHDSL